MVELAPDIIYNSINIIIIFISSLLSFMILFKFKKSKIMIAWAIILISFIINIFAGILSIQTISLGIAQPAYINWVSIASYLLLGIGVLIYWLMLKKRLENKIPFKNLSAIILIIITAYITLAYFDINPLNIVPIILIVLATIPLVMLFKGGNLSKQWLLICIGAVTLILAKMFYYIGSATLLNVTLTTGNIFIMIGLSKMYNY